MRITRVGPLHPAASIVTLALAFAGSARAHDPGLSTARLTLAGSTLQLSVTFARCDVEVLTSLDANSPELDPGRTADLRSRVAALAVEGIVVRLDGHRARSRRV